MENNEKLLVQIDERVKAINQKIDTLFASLKEQEETIKEHSTRITTIEAKTSGKKDLILVVMYVSAIALNVFTWVKFVK